MRLVLNTGLRRAAFCRGGRRIRTWGPRSFAILPVRPKSPAVDHRLRRASSTRDPRSVHGAPRRRRRADDLRVSSMLKKAGLDEAGWPIRVRRHPAGDTGHPRRRQNLSMNSRTGSVAVVLRRSRTGRGPWRLSSRGTSLAFAVGTNFHDRDQGQHSTVGGDAHDVGDRPRGPNGEGGIRTHGDPEATPVFKTGAFNRSANPGKTGAMPDRLRVTGAIGAGRLLVHDRHLPPFRRNL